MSYGYKYNQDSQKQALIGTIAGLVKELSNLAPHPDCASYKGPLFIKSNPHFKLASDRDGMLGSMIMEGILGAAFSQAVSDMAESAAQGLGYDCEFDMPNIDITNLMDCYDEYINDLKSEKEKQQIAAHGQGTLARMSGKSISSGFNMRATISEGMQAFYDDLPKRMMIEKNMAYYAQQLNILESAPSNQNAMPVPSMAA
jgi:hypothetical protein